MIAASGFYVPGWYWVLPIAALLIAAVTFGLVVYAAWRGLKKMFNTRTDDE